ncbi:hypothetical protein [Peribacillus simplex]|uniref:hypothetical protein n=1 Tax=Peribacillus simplex TaxID=1478 RepID=UPI001623C6F9|nr:hypothetical protein [Peribacillus simplex]
MHKEKTALKTALISANAPVPIHEAAKISASPQRMKIGLYVDNALMAGEEGR